MAAPKGHPRYGGRKAGTPNKITATVRQRFEEAFEKLQSSDKANLTTWAEENPTEFYKLSAKLIPTDVAVQGALTLNVITGVPQAQDEQDLA